MPLPGATVQIQNTTTGTVTDGNGRFKLETDKSLPLNLLVTYVGYDPRVVTVNSVNEPISIQLDQQEVNLEAIEVTGSRITEERQKAPLTMETMDITAIKETPAADFYQGLGNLTGVDMTTASLGFKVINTRGFNSTSPVRSLQIIDGVDNQSPGLNFSLGNFLGSSELDIMKVDIIQGAASPFYGPNAFNGVISMVTKDPFYHPGLSVQVKTGERGLVDVATRWAQVVKNEAGTPIFAYKLNVAYLRANDWEATNYDPVDASEVSANNPGRYDAVNRYGDEYYPLNDATGIEPWSNEAGLGTFFRTGYREIDLVDYDTRNFKSNLVAQLRLQPNQREESTELILASSMSNGTTVYQGDNRFSLRNISFFQNRIELRKWDKFFIRLYATHENSGKSFDPYATALKLQERIKSNENWSLDYRKYWQSKIAGRMRSYGYPQLIFDPNTGMFTFDYDAAEQWMINYHDSLVVWHMQAKDQANIEDNEYLEPGTIDFQTAFDQLTTSKNNAEEEGTLFYDRSALYHIHGEYQIASAFLEEWRVGANARLYAPRSDGTIFSDTGDVRLTNFEFGVYTGATRKFLDERLTVSATVRFDKNENFKPVISPAASLVYTPQEDHYIRLSFSSALRNPTLADQYLFLNVGPAILTGNLNGADSLITLESFSDYRNALNSKLLRYFSVDPVRPEQVRTVEVGYRGIFFKYLYLDASFYFNVYNNFLGYNIGIDADISDFGLIQSLQVYRLAANSEQQVTTQGFNIGLRYFWRRLVFTGNYSWNKLNTIEEDPIIPAFNTPEHKFNLGISGRDLQLKLFGKDRTGFGFNINYKWVEGFLFEGSPQFTGYVPTYSLLDAQINYRSAPINTTFKLGATNVLNTPQIQTYGGPKIGRLAYFSILYEWRNPN